MIFLKLFWDFFKVSCFTFGGAYGAIPLIRDMVMKNGWLTEEELLNMIDLAYDTVFAKFSKKEQKRIVEE